MIAAVAHETSETKPTDEDWAREIARFRIYRDLEADPAVMKRAARLPALLRAEAAPIYAAANELDRTLTMNAIALDCQASQIVDRIKKRDYDGDQFWEYIWDELQHHLLERVTHSPSAYRQRANALANAAEDAELALAYYDKCLREIRAPSGRGAKPSVAMYSLIAAADRWNATNDQIAARLADARIPSDSNAETLSLKEQWIGILEKARPRARDRLNQDNREG